MAHVANRTKESVWSGTAEFIFEFTDEKKYVASIFNMMNII